MKKLPVTSASAGRQRGVSLFFALIALVSLALAAVALVRSVDTGALVLGNMGFKQDATASSDQVAEVAMTWLATNAVGTTLDADNTAAGYYASSFDALDAAGNGTAADRALVDWNDDDCAYGGSFTGVCVGAAPVATYNGNTGSYVITRLCATVGAATDAANTCAVPLSGVAGQGPNRGEIRYGTARLSGGGGGPYYRILVRTVGGRGTVSYTETVVHF
jgi:Tfp pilus assembly protein PilX